MLMSEILRLRFNDIYNKGMYLIIYMIFNSLN